MDRTAKNSISFGNTLSYCRGSAYSISKVETLKNFYSKFFLKRIKIALNFWRYTIHGDINFTKAKSMFKPLNQNYFYIFLYPISFFLCIRDNILGKVRKTHIEFNKNMGDGIKAISSMKDGRKEELKKYIRFLTD